MTSEMDAAAAPTYIDSVESRPARRRDAVSEEQLLYAESIGIPVPESDFPYGRLLGDSHWDTKTAHRAAFVVSGTLWHVPWRLLVVKEQQDFDFGSLVERSMRPVHEHLSKWNPQSELSELNRTRYLAEASPMLLEALELYAGFAPQLDPTVGPLLDAWKESLAAGGTPNGKRISQLLANVGLAKHVSISGREIRILGTSTLLDLDAVSKGIAVDLISAEFDRLNLKDFLFDWGGEGIARGKHPSGRAWSIGVLAPPSLREVFSSWKQNRPPTLERAVIKIALEKNGELTRFATSGDYMQSKQFAYFHLVDSTSGMMLQASVSATASVSVFSSISSASLVDAIATAAMMFRDPREAHAWLHSVRDKYRLSRFFVSSRSNSQCLSEANAPIEPKHQPLRFVGGFSLSPETLLAIQPRSAELLQFNNSGDMSATQGTLLCTTVRMASLAPPILSLLLDPTTQRLPARNFTLSSFGSLLSCCVLHESHPLVLCSVSVSSGKNVDIRRRLDLPFSARIVCNNKELAQCSSLAFAGGLCSWNAEQHGNFGVHMQEAKEGDAIDVYILHLHIRVILREMHSVGDHWVFIAGIEKEIVA